MGLKIIEMVIHNMNFDFFKKFRRIRKNVVFMTAGIIFTAYFIIVSIYWGMVDNFNAAMIFAGILWIIIAIKANRVLQLFNKLPKFIRIFSSFILVSFLLSFVIVEGIIIYNMNAALDHTEADYVVILGCQVDGSLPSIPLTRRVNTSVEYLNENQNTNVIITGGKGYGENISEAEAMKRILLRSGVDENRIFEEQNAKSTVENLKFSDELYHLTDKNIVIVSSDYHLFRALSTAKKLNYKNVGGLPSKSQLSALPVYLLREYAAVIYYVLSGKM
jgi:uncharacterized SAM-binding protein YcdF (DUF218 family)